MTKSEEVAALARSTPGSGTYDGLAQTPLARSADDEPVFVLVARDACAPATIRAWVDKVLEVSELTTSDPKIKEALDLANAMEDWQFRNTMKIPD
jgi:hypothetical protein